MVGCGKEESKTTTIYGTVFNSYSGNPVSKMEVQLWRKNYSSDSYSHMYNQDVLGSSVSGSDGQYEIPLYIELHPNDTYYKYALKVTCEGYSTYSREISIENGNAYRFDINLEPEISEPIVARPTIYGNSPYEVSSYVIDDGGRPIVETGFEYIVNYGYGDICSISCGFFETSFHGQILTNYALKRVRAYASNGTYIGYSEWVYLVDKIIG
jgi:5-hydroxyisourate hydrolase-like protein (transthyretin family)